MSDVTHLTQPTKLIEFVRTETNKVCFKTYRLNACFLFSFKIVNNRLHRNNLYQWSYLHDLCHNRTCKNGECIQDNRIKISFLRFVQPCRNKFPSSVQPFTLLMHFNWPDFFCTITPSKLNLKYKFEKKNVTAWTQWLLY